MQGEGQQATSSLLQDLLSPEVENQKESRPLLRMLSFRKCITGILRACSKIMTREAARGGASGSV